MSNNEDGFTPLHMDNVKNKYLYSIRLTEDILDIINASGNDKCPTIKFSNGEMVLTYSDQPDIIGTVVSEEKPHFCYNKDEDYGYISIGSVKNKIVIKSSFKKKDIPNIQYEKQSKNTKPTEVIQLAPISTDKVSKKVGRTREVEDAEIKKKRKKVKDEENSIIEPLVDVIIDEELLNKTFTIKNDKDWKRCVELYKKFYPSYRKLFIQLEKNRNELIQIQSSPSANKLQSKFKKILNERDEMIKKMIERYNFTHNKLKELKHEIDAYYKKKYHS